MNSRLLLHDFWMSPSALPPFVLTCLEEERSVSSSEAPQTTVFRISGSNFSMRLIAAAIILLFFYYAAGVVITLLLSVLIA